MFKSLTLRALVNERLSAAADDVFALFEKTICEYEEELSRCKEENKRKQRLLDFLCPKVVPVRGGGQKSVTQEITEVPRVTKDQKDDEEEVKQEEEQLPVCVPESSVSVKVEESEEFSLQDQSVHQAPIKEEDISPKPHVDSQTEELTEQSSDTDNDDDWGAPLSSSVTPMETEAEGDPCSRDQNTAAPETSTAGNSGDNEKTHECSVCRKTFKRKDHLQAHSLVHAEDKPYNCSLCDKTFKHAPHLKVHMRTHTGERPYSCSVCDKTFRYTSTLKTHMRTHTGEKPFGCSHCDKTFAQIGNLQAHIRCHTGETPYSCTLCHKTFAQSYSLKTHMVTHTSERPYTCSVCSKVYGSVRALTDHMRTHREQEPSNEESAEQSQG